jgi:hypothetical protein
MVLVARHQKENVHNSPTSVSVSNSLDIAFSSLLDPKQTNSHLSSIFHGLRYFLGFANGGTLSLKTAHTNVLMAAPDKGDLVKDNVMRLWSMVMSRKPSLHVGVITRPPGGVVIS